MREEINRHSQSAEEINGHSQSAIPKIIIILTVLLFVVAAVSAFFILRPSDSRTVEIVQDGKVLYTFDLDFTKTKILTISYEGGSSNTITIQDGEIWVSEAECPDQTCVKMGKLKSDYLPIVCLPNRLMIRYVK